MWHGYYLGGGWWMLLLGVAFWGSIVALIIWAVARAGARQNLENERPLDILRKRYARGEISREEYERVRNDLAKE